MSAQNLYQANWIKAQGTNIASTNAQITTGRTVLHAIVVNSHTSGLIHVANGTLTSKSFVGGTYTPATGSSVIPFYELEFTDGLFVELGGTANLTVIYNDL